MITSSRANRAHLNGSFFFGRAARRLRDGDGDFGRVQGSHQTCAFLIWRYSSTEMTTSVRVMMNAIDTP